MGRRAYSDDLRGLVVAEVETGASRRAAAQRFKVSVSSAIRWVTLHGETGSVSAKGRGGKIRSPLEQHASWLLDLIAQEPDLTLGEIEQRLLAARGIRTTDSSIDRFFKRHKMSLKKILHATEQDRPDVAEARQSWKAGQARLDPKRLVFVDRGRCLRGQRLIGKAPWGHWKTTTFTAGLRCDGLVAPWILDGPMNGEAFLVYVEKVLAPTLSVGDIVVIDNLPAHKVEGVRKFIEARGATLLYLPPYSPDLNPIEMPSPSLKRCCAKPLSEPEKPSGTKLDKSSKPSRHRNVPTISHTLIMRRSKWEML